jgi:hypothetical protein
LGYNKKFQQVSLEQQLQVRDLGAPAAADATRDEHTVRKDVI